MSEDHSPSIHIMAITIGSDGSLEECYDRYLGDEQ